MLKRSTKSRCNWRLLGRPSAPIELPYIERRAAPRPRHSRGRQNWAAVVGYVHFARLRVTDTANSGWQMCCRASEIIGGSERRFRAFRACYSDSIISTPMLSPSRPLCCLRCYPIAPLLCRCATINVRLHAATIERLFFNMQGLIMRGKERCIARSGDRNTVRSSQAITGIDKIIKIRLRAIFIFNF